MIYGYARVSTAGQAKDGNSLEGQRELLLAAGANEVVEEAYTGTKIARPVLDKLIERLKCGDTLMVAKLDRLSRTAAEGSTLIKKLTDAGIKVNILNMGVCDTASSIGKLLTNVLLAFAEFERDMIVERTQSGKEIAKQNPDFKEGRPRKYTDDEIARAIEMLETESYRKVAKNTGISVSTLVRVKNG